MGALISAPISMAMTCCGSLVGSCCASLTCKACSCACLVPGRIASFVYLATLATFVFFALITRYDGGDIVFGGGYNASEASLMDQAQHWAKQGTGWNHEWNSRFWCAARHPDGWVVCCEDVCGGVYGVYRFSFALCLFFAFLALLTSGTTKFGAKVHRGFWFPKAFLLLGLFISTLFIDNHAMEGYRETSRYLSWCFLLLQILLLIDFGCAESPPPPPCLPSRVPAAAATSHAGRALSRSLPLAPRSYNWNEKWLAYDEASDNDQFWGSWKSGIVMAAAGLNLGSLGMWIFLYNAFAPDGCPAQNAVITLTLIFTIGLTIISVTKIAPHGTLLTSAVVTAYCTFLAYSALASHPDGECNPMKTDPGNSWSDLWVGLLLGIVSITSIANAALGSKSALIGEGRRASPLPSPCASPAPLAPRRSPRTFHRARLPLPAPQAASLDRR